MKTIVRLFTKLTAKDMQTPLGRWKLTYCDKMMKLKVDLSNEDHCGPCGQYAKFKLVDHAFAHAPLQKSRCP
jgi:hypothetical protein